MLDLDSTLWDHIPSSCGMDSATTVALLRRAKEGDDSVYPELYHRVCHQFTIGPASFVVVPHLVAIARDVEVTRRLWPLSIVGAIAAANGTKRESNVNIQSDWLTEYLSSNADALTITADALTHKIWNLSESQILIATLAALLGHANLAMHLFLQEEATRLSCPMCGEYIDFIE